MEFLKLLETARSPVADRFFQFATYLGQEELVLIILCLLYWCFHKNLAYQLAFTYFSSGLLVQALKITFRIPRPWVLDPEFKAVESAVPAATGYSFPSGHTQGGTSMFTTLALVARHRALQILCVIAFLLVGFSRLYLGVHTPKDVLVSMGLSIFFSYLMYRFMQRYKEDHSKDLMISIILAVIAAFVCIYALVLLSSGRIELKYAVDCCKAAGAGLAFAVGWYVERTWIRFDTGNGSLKLQIFKFLAGGIVLLIMKSVLKGLLGTSVGGEIIRYFLLVLWIIVLYPLIFTRLNPRKI